ncbi:MAG TPA: diacylglycerol kinase family protein [Sandaracinaceae bacterium LLY-WYZ-13_1]|nr:diacylglycerol kinase family protein [Sandaracinaceae bacterium LLY-WYZ-13_1]
MHVGVVLNPQARKNRRRRGNRVERLARALGSRGEVRETRSVEELGEAVEALLPRVTHLVSDGGDGALHWLINEVRARVEDPADWPTFVPTNGGTIDFVARKVGVRGRSRTILKALAAAAAADRPPPEHALDTLRLRGAYRDGAPFDRIGFALAAGGIGNRFFDKYYEDPDPSPATIVRVISRTVGDFAMTRVAPRLVNGESYAAHLFSPTRARVVIDGEEVPSHLHSGLHAGAFDVNLGGVLRVFPLARQEGVLHFQAGEMTPSEIIAHLPALVAGGAIRGRKLRDTAGREMVIEADPDDPLCPIVDGERFEDLAHLEVHAGPRVRIGRVRA